MQQKQQEWFTQWQIFNENETLFLLQDWIYPQRLEDFGGLTVLEAGCGGGVHTALIAPLARHVTAVDLNTVELARQRLEEFKNVSFLEADIATMDLGHQFDVVMSVAVVHHTDDPDKTVENLKRHVKPGGKLILWVYAREGNGFVEYFIEPIRKFLIKHFHRRVVLSIAWGLTVFLYIPVFTLYRLPFKFLPYWEYFGNFRRLSFNRNYLNVFDKLNAPQVTFLENHRVRSWFDGDEFEVLHLSHYKGVSWRVTARRR